ncbi:CGNR zinc finger domain-containing protein [Streptomyces mirabilis]|nr:CGNR zinc finger domain-containing protein [Streptomyces mirabilis]
MERLPDPDALARWITEAGLSAGADDTPVRVTEGDLTHARTLREALHRLVRAAMAGRHPTRPMSRGPTRRRPAPTSPPARRSRGTTARTPAALRWTAERPGPAALATVARDAVLLVGGPLLARVKECENPECSLLFLDDSQARRRRWCSMDRCGNLAKVAGYRSRSRTGSSR